MMDAIERRLLAISRVAAGCGVACLLLVAGVSVVDIVMREALGRPLSGGDDIAGIAIILIISTCFPAGLLERRQIQVRLLGGFIGRWGARTLDTIAAVATLAMFLGIAVYVTDYAGSRALSAQQTMVLGIPVAPWWWASAVCFWLCLPAQAFVVIAEAIGKPAPRPEASDEPDEARREA